MTTPDYTDGSGCWRYGVLENGNTGQMRNTNPADVPVVKLGYDDLLKACDVEDSRTLAGYWMDRRGMVLRACYQPIENVIYSYNLNWGSYYEAHEQCHILHGREHNACWNRVYAIGQDESACNWNEEV